MCYTRHSSTASVLNRRDSSQSTWNSHTLIVKNKEVSPSTSLEKKFFVLTRKSSAAKPGSKILRITSFFACKLYIYFMQRNVFCYLTSTVWLSKPELQAGVT